jgi:hypothetical protein
MGQAKHSRDSVETLAHQIRLEWAMEKRNLDMTSTLIELYLAARARNVPLNLAPLVEEIQAYAKEEWGKDAVVLFSEGEAHVKNPKRGLEAMFVYHGDKFKRVN